MSENYEDDLSISYDALQSREGNRDKRERIKQLGAPHIIMQDRLNSMNPLTFGDTIRLPNLLNGEGNRGISRAATGNNQYYS
jgi:hypothetical protein